MPSSIPPQPQDLGLPAETFPTFRQGQLDLAIQLALSPARFPLLNAPCGSGKSLAYMTASYYADLRTCIVTPQKSLQDQYCRDFPGIADVRGQSNYICPRYGNCEIGAVNECPNKRTNDSVDRCPYLKAIDHARQSKRVVTNTAFWLTQGKKATSALALDSPFSSPGIGSFDMLVLDEGHGIPERLAEFCAITLLERELDNLLDTTFPESSSFRAWSEWARETSPKIHSRLKDGVSARDRFRLLSIARNLADLASIANDTATQWIFQSFDGGTKVSFTPVWATASAETLLFQSTPKVVLASATLLPNIGTYLGINSSTSEYIDVRNGFDPRNRPFIYVDAGIEPITYRMYSNPSKIRILASKYDQIIDLWRGYKGIYHTQSYELQSLLLTSSRNRHRFIVCEQGARGLKSADAIRMLKESHADSIVVGPGLKEGIDLPHDLARFQIIARMPLVVASDPVVKARCASIPTYAMDRTATDILQMKGRPDRAIDDWATTFTADKMWGRVRKEARFPESFIECCRWETGTVPGPPKR
jgi:ATP-dependent DNA helicase DinG